ncbi:glycosyltransferase family 39 protein [Butyrivibrio sp. WCD2001]|uniref:glycosyltransferase family 39 protein n=1 Tax=Butyrivibrio sp. WCD2001 TaxID=1280681 RepID=UPI000421364E|nr:glycosyltransferase family 39 protein [Butyrivibrio sp. WCD2001]
MHKALRKLAMVFFVPFTALCLLILAASSVTTIYYDTDQGADLPRFGAQNYLILIVGAALFLLAAYFLTKTHKKVLFSIVLIAEALLCLVIIFTSDAVAVTDGLTLDKIINAFNAGDYSSLEKGGYMFVYPFQIGYVAIGQILADVFGPSNYLVFQIINLAAILVSVIFLHKITRELFEDDGICEVLDLLSLLMFFLYSYVTYVYNDIWSVAPGILALYFEICYLKKHEIKDELFAALFLGFGCLLKTNLYIALIAMAILLVADLLQGALTKADKFRGRCVMSAAFIILLVVMALCPLKLIGNVYAKKAGLSEYPDGVPSSTYFAMAMQEGEGEWGWYNGFNWNTYAEADYDPELTGEKAKAAIDERLSEFRERPLHAVKFYVRKLLTQWADPTHISLRNYELSMRHSESKSAFAHSLVYGTWSKIFQAVMDVAHFLVYFGVCIYCFATIRKKSLDLPQALLILFVFGGMLFHEIWEGSSRYIIRYYLTLLPFGAYGIKNTISFISGLTKRR